MLVVLAGCGRSAASVKSSADPGPTSLADLPIAHVVGESMAWEVYWQAMLVGRAELTAVAREARCSFHTSTLASAIASVRFEHVTKLDARGAVSSTEQLTRDRSADFSEVGFDGSRYTLGAGPAVGVPGGGRLHTVTTALAIVRTWAALDSHPGFLWLIHRDELYRLDLPRPMRDEALGKPALRVDAIVRSLDRTTEMDISIWLGLDLARTPLRFVVEAGEDRVAAELVESTTL